MKNLILDANNLLYRIFWVNKNIKDGNINMATLMFLRSVKSYVDKFKPDHIYAAWDKKLLYPSSNFRKTTSKGNYKSNRDGEVAKEAHKNDETLRELMDHLGIKSIYPYRLEADDVISWLTEVLHGKKQIITVDKDLYQLIDQDTLVFNPIQKAAITKENFENFTKGVSLQNFLDYKSIIGDNSDNIKGLPKIGHKRAIKLLEKYNKTPHWDQILTKENFKVYEHNHDMMDLQYGWRYYKEEEISYKEQLQQGMPKKDSTKFFNRCCELGIDGIVTNRDKWVNSFFSTDIIQELVDKVNLLNNKYINNRYATTE